MIQLVAAAAVCSVRQGARPAVSQVGLSHWCCAVIAVCMPHCLPPSVHPSVRLSSSLRTAHAQMQTHT